MKAGRLLTFLFAAAMTAGALWALSHAQLTFNKRSDTADPASRVVPPQFPPATPFAQPPMPSVQNTGRLAQRSIEESDRS